MELLSTFSILKYGAKIFLAVMGFISFEDINVKPVGNNTDINVNYVESIPIVKHLQTENPFYADASYFISDKKSPSVLLTNQKAEWKGINDCEFITQFENNLEFPDKIIMLGNKNIEDFDIVIFNENDNTEFEYHIKVIEDLNTVQKVDVSLRTLQISNSFSSY